MLTDLVVDLLVAQIGLGADTCLLKLRHHLRHIVVRFGNDGGNNNLTRCQPEGQLAGMFLDQDPQKPFERSQTGPVQHHRAMPCPVRADIACAQSVRKVRVHLQRAALPVASDGIGQGKLQFRAIEGPFALQNLVIVASGAAGITQRLFQKIPALIRSDALFRPGGQFDCPVMEAQIRIDLRQKGDETGGLTLDLVFGAENVPVILHKAAHPHDSVQCARRLVAVTGPEFCNAQGQVAIGFQALIVDLHMAGAVHRLERIDGLFARMFLIHLDDEHMVLIFFPVARRLPELSVQHLRGIDLHITAGALPAAHVFAQLGVDGPAVGVPENLPRRFFLHVKELHLAPQATVVALLGFFEERQMRLQFFAVLESHAIDALQHRAIAVAAPISPGHAHQLEGIGR